MVTLVGGPEDGRDVDVRAERVEDLPQVINVASEPPSTVADFLTADEPAAVAPACPVHRYRRDRQRSGPLSRWRYTYEGTS
jgi:hypothetical protein